MSGAAVGCRSRGAAVDRASGNNRPLDRLNAVGGQTMKTCKALGFIDDDTLGTCLFGAATTTCGYDVSSGYYRYGNSCQGCTLNTGPFATYVLQGPMNTASVLSSMDGSMRNRCKAR
ncbi:hypothetical protein [Polyangium mundeleinium]|uniref:Uncharacterized protein n=1 Tax=Polyangium mundeleinium TaxID=2995306 RepID=A0ABT5EJ25_9BACT|nr:hypothetical protein [Polyangium mundeleinium]MDC0740755.1 hypothetical protein [Polyangium mundeleinium]